MGSSASFKGKNYEQKIYINQDYKDMGNAQFCQLVK